MRNARTPTTGRVKNGTLHRNAKASLRPALAEMSAFDEESDPDETSVEGMGKEGIGDM